MYFIELRCIITGYFRTVLFIMVNTKNRNTKHVSLSPLPRYFEKLGIWFIHSFASHFMFSAFMYLPGYHDSISVTSLFSFISRGLFSHFNTCVKKRFFNKNKWNLIVMEIKVNKNWHIAISLKQTFTVQKFWTF